MENTDINFENTRLIDLTVRQFRELINQHPNVIQVQEKEDPEEYLPAIAASKKINVALSTLYGMVCRKEISVHKPSKKLFFKIKDLNYYIENARKKSKVEFLEDFNKQRQRSGNRNKQVRV